MRLFFIALFSSLIIASCGSPETKENPPTEMQPVEQPQVIAPVEKPAIVEEKKKTIYPYQDKVIVLRYQKILNQLNYKIGKIDGIMGKNTTLAITNFQTDHGLQTSGRLDITTKATLDGMAR
jgi:hypothetical protein